MKTIINPNVIQLGPVRTSYMNLFKARERTMEDGTKVFKYDVCLLIPKTKTEQRFLKDARQELLDLNAAIEATFTKKFGAGLKLLQKHHPVHDGDELKEDGTAKMAGYWLLSASQGVDTPPTVMDGTANEIKGGWQSGDWGIAELNLYAYERAGKKSVSVYIRGFQFLYHDTALGTSSVVSFASVQDAEPPSMLPMGDPGGGGGYQPDDSDDPFAEN